MEGTWLRGYCLPTPSSQCPRATWAPEVPGGWAEASATSLVSASPSSTASLQCASSSLRATFPLCQLFFSMSASPIVSQHLSHFSYSGASFSVSDCMSALHSLLVCLCHRVSMSPFQLLSPCQCHCISFSHRVSAPPSPQSCWIHFQQLHPWELPQPDKPLTASLFPGGLHMRGPTPLSPEAAV